MSEKFAAKFNLLQFLFYRLRLLIGNMQLDNYSSLKVLKSSN